MSHKTAHFLEAVEILKRVPDGTYFSIGLRKTIEFQATTQDEARAIRHSLPPFIRWEKSYDRSVGWWEYAGESDGWKFRIYAVKEAPPACKAIVERRTVKELVPTGWTEREVERDVITGWDCGGNGTNPAPEAEEVPHA